MRKILIIGNHPLLFNLIQQYKANGSEIHHYQKNDDEVIRNIDCDELFLLSDINYESVVEADNMALVQLGRIASNIKKGEKKKICHLMLRSHEMLQRLHSLDFCEAIREKLDVYLFTMEEIWSRTLRLDYEPITIESEKHIHLVIIGMDEMAETLAFQSALIAHYPNYIRDLSKRTRITIVDKQMCQKSKDFINRYQHLFENSYYRIVNLTEAKPISLHKPKYNGIREDFVDVEWEFVEATIDNLAVRKDFLDWATDNNQLLTIVMAHSEDNQNIREATLLPNAIYQQSIPIYVYTPHNIDFIIAPNMIPFGMQDRGYDVTMPFVGMAKNINYIYRRCYEDNIEQWKNLLRNVVEIDKTVRDALWEELPYIKRMSCIYHAMTIATKMRSIGLSENDWKGFNDISMQNIEILAQVEHNRWCIEELILGWRPCTEEEQKMVEADIKMKKELKKQKIHYDLRAYHDLRPDEIGKPVEIYDMCLCSFLPLIARTFIEEQKGVGTRIF